MNRGTGDPRGAAERGMTLVFLAFALVAILGMLALGVDLGMLYVARNDAQRAADAAAIAGAWSLSSSACIVASSCAAGGAQETAATAQAIAVGEQQTILGEPADIQSSDVSFSYPNGWEPQITVTVQRSAARGNAVPTLFAKIFGTNSGDVSATATAEADNGATAQGKVLPLLVPNCFIPQQNETATGWVENPTCGIYNGNNTTALTYPSQTGGIYGYEFVSQGGASGTPDTLPAGQAYSAAIGQSWELHYNGTYGVPSQFYLVDFYDSSGAVTNSGSVIANEIVGTNSEPITCGEAIYSATGAKTGDIIPPMNDLIGASSDGLDNGQDAIIGPVLTTAAAGNPEKSLENQYCTDYLIDCADTNVPLPLDILPGTSSPYYQSLTANGEWQQIQSGSLDWTSSNSIVSVPVYQDVSNQTIDVQNVVSGSSTYGTNVPSTALNPGSGNEVTVAGFVQMFIVDAYHHGTDKVVDGIVTGIMGCNGSSSGTAVTDTAAGPPVRLIQGPTTASP